MTVVLISVLCYGIALGFIQGYLDPQNYKSRRIEIHKFTKELELTEYIGILLGAATALGIEILRQLEIIYKRKAFGVMNSLETQLEMNVQGLTPRNPLGDDEEEDHSFFSQPINRFRKEREENHDFDNLELKSDSEEEIF